MKNIILTICSSFVVASFFAQNEFSYQEFRSLVLLNHPLAKQAALKPMMGESQVLKSKGGFDPKMFTDYASKNDKGVNYYQELNAGLSIPTWYGVQVKSGFESNNGSYVNPENKTPAGGLWYGGVSLSLGQGMIIDQRRAELFKARIFQESTIQEQKLLLNELLYESGYAYWNWFLAHYSTQVLQNSLDLATIRLNGVKTSAELGDRPIIDTVEARIQVQYRQSLLTNYETDLLNAKLKIESFLWTQSQEPLELNGTSLPMEIDSVGLELMPFISDVAVDTMVQNHPYLTMTNLKIKSLEIDQKLKKEQLKPTLNLTYNLINEPINYNPFNTISPNNNKIGVQFEMPLLYRKERGELQLAKLKVQDEQLDYMNNRMYLTVKIKQAQNDVLNAQRQLEIYQQTVVDSKELFEAEKTMFDQGESSLFLVNARELSYIQAKLKYIEVLSKYQQSLLSLRFSMANLW
ncbi:MAG: TolC family protein [Crocinitomicaceae bacterium]